MTPISPALVDCHRYTLLFADVLAERLKCLTAHGILEPRPYSERPPRHEYRLTEKGSELCDVLLAVMAWGDRWAAGDAGPPVLVRHRGCGELTHGEVRCATCGEPLHASEIDVEPGPGRSMKTPA